jgi:hypothetical protein
MLYFGSFYLFCLLYVIHRFNGHLRKKGISGHIKVDYEKKLLFVEVRCFSPHVSCEPIQYDTCWFVFLEIRKEKPLKHKRGGIT